MYKYITFVQLKGRRDSKEGIIKTSAKKKNLHFKICAKHKSRICVISGQDTFILIVHPCSFQSVIL